MRAVAILSSGANVVMFTALGIVMYFFVIALDGTNEKSIDPVGNATDVRHGTIGTVLIVCSLS